MGSSFYTLKTLLIVSFGVLAIALTAVLSLVIEHISSRQMEEEIGGKLAELAFQVADKLDRGMFERYRDIQVIASLDAIQTLNTTDIRTTLEKVQSTYLDYAWIGLADTQGKVLVATGDLLEGADVSQRPWFRQGLKAPFVGDVHQALLLSKLLPNTSDEPLRFVDVSVPVTNPQGDLVGVLGAHLNWQWAREIEQSILKPIQKRSQIDILILSDTGTVLLGPPELQGHTLELEEVRAAKEGQNSYLIEQWPDGVTSLIGFSRSEGYRSYPGLGWLVLVRQDIDLALAPIDQLQYQILAWGLVIGMLFTTAGWPMAARIAGPLLTITRAAGRIQQGDNRIQIPVLSGYTEVNVLSSSLNRLIADLIVRETQLEHQATHDVLTELPNRTLFQDRISHAIHQAQRTDLRVGVLFMDLDRFRVINDGLGHAAGDLLLQAIAERLRASVREGDMVARQGGDEFVVMVLEDLSQEILAASVGHRLLKALESPFVLEDQEFFISASIGISIFPQDGQDTQTLIKNADAALHRAKALGGKTLQFYAQDMNIQTRDRLELEKELRYALDRQQLELHYQPQVDLKTGQITGVEALLRWQHPQRGRVSPLEFIPLAEETLLIVPLGEWVIRTACTQAKAWQAAGLPAIQMAVNLSARQFAQADLTDRIAQILQENGLEARYLKLEITESLLMQDREGTITTLNTLHAMGISLSIDDFGTGYSSLSYLRRFPIHQLKIDRSFIRDLSTAPDSAAIAKAVLALGHSLKLKVIAEGVETEDQLVFLRTRHCDEIQGYYFSPPLGAEAMTALLRENRLLKRSSAKRIKISS